MMLRRLLACFALVTGFAAVSTPAQANLIEAFSTQIEAGDKQTHAKKEKRCECHHEKRGKRDRETPARPCEDPQPVRIFLPTVQLGVDLSLE